MNSSPSNWKLEPAPEYGAVSSLHAPRVNCFGRRFLSELNGLLNYFFNSPATGFRVSVVEDAEQVPSPARRGHPLPTFARFGIVCERDLKNRWKLALGFHGS